MMPKADTRGLGGGFEMSRFFTECPTLTKA
jgi:hypothetical protein